MDYEQIAGFQPAMLQLIADEHDSEHAIGIFDATSHPKQGDQTPGVQRQWCGQTGKTDNGVIAQHLLYSDGHSTNPFNCIIADVAKKPIA